MVSDKPKIQRKNCLFWWKNIYMFFISFISHHFPDAATYWSKNPKCFYTPAVLCVYYVSMCTPAVLITINDGDSVSSKQYCILHSAPSSINFLIT